MTNHYQPFQNYQQPMACFVCVDHDHVKWRAKVFSSQFSDSLALAVRGPLFCSYHIMTSYSVSITERAKAKCYLVVKFEIFAKMYVLYFSMEISFLVSRQ